MKCPTCESCEYAQYCGATEIMRKCERHNKKVEQTNEEWLRSATAEQLAELLTNIQTDGYFGMGMTYEERLAWLKEKHETQM